MKQRVIITFFLSLIFSIASASAADLGAVKKAMQQRLPQIESLWSQGLVGENNQGYLEARGSLSADQTKLVAAENADRKTVYTAIAKSANVSAAQVGQQRALQISKGAKPGLWLQDTKGNWYKK
ncbi:YdbL family protein [Cerasicoccus maritimus]|uniref:YdbL family protein n=1 Tax=Cerasicoccus maritimus TaxID=490089 RepID=UPI002852ACB0|nr:YdbL family protein [Cerasicoccus maritimus]